MNKPQSLSMREWLVRKLAPKLLVSEKIVDAVVAHQFSEANAAMHTNNSIEISGFGKFIFNTKKAQKKMDNFLAKKASLEELLKDNTLSEARRQTVVNKLNSLNLGIEILKPKIYVENPVSDLRGVEEQTHPTCTFEEYDRASKQV